MQLGELNMEDLVLKYSRELTNLLLGENITINGSLIRKHSVDLKKNGDFSFPKDMKAWIPVLGNSSNDNNRYLLGENFSETKLEEICRNSFMSLCKVIVIYDRVHVYLNRPIAFNEGLRSFLDCESASSLLTNNLAFTDLFVKDCDLTELRGEIVKNAASNYFKVLDVERTIEVSTKSHKGAEIGIFCGPVLNLETGVKECTLSSTKLLEERSTEVHMQARHKFGQRPTKHWTKILDDITKSVICYEFLAIKPSSALKLDLKPGSSSARAAAFIEYNCARMEKLLKSFNQAVVENYYPSLPQLEDIDFNQLNDENEWRLFFNYIVPFQHSFGSKEANFAPHALCAFCSALVRDFSVYYKKTVILRENRTHLIPGLHARITLLTAINKVLKACMKILNMKIIDEM